MNEQLLEKLNKFGTNLVDALESGTIWAKEQTGELAKEIVNLWIVENCVYLFVGLIIAVALFWTSKWCKKAKNDDANHSYDARQAFSAFHGICFAAAFAVLIPFLCIDPARIAKGIVAPRVVILEKLSEIARGNVANNQNPQK